MEEVEEFVPIDVPTTIASERDLQRYHMAYSMVRMVDQQRKEASKRAQQWCKAALEKLDGMAPEVVHATQSFPWLGKSLFGNTHFAGRETQLEWEVENEKDLIDSLVDFFPDGLDVKLTLAELQTINEAPVDLNYSINAKGRDHIRRLLERGTVLPGIGRIIPPRKIYVTKLTGGPREALTGMSNYDRAAIARLTNTTVETQVTKDTTDE